MNLSDERRRANDALLAGRIGAGEHDYYSQYLRKQSRQKTSMIVAAAVLFLALFGAAAMLFSTGGLTGLVVFESVTNQTTTVIEQNVTNVTVTGTLFGEGTAQIVFVTPTREYLVADLTSDPGTPRTAKAAYLQSEDVTVEHAPPDATYYFDDGTASAPTALPFAATTGTLLIVTNETTYRLPVIIGTDERATRFENACVETCAIAATTGTIEIRTDGAARVTINQVNAVAAVTNSAPLQLAAIPDVVLNATTTIDLAPYFSDPDGDDLTFQVNNMIGIEETIDGDTLTLAGTTPGEYATYAYASDGQALIVSNAFRIIVPEPAALPGVSANVSTNETTNENTTTNETAIAPPANNTVNNETNTTVTEFPLTPTTNITGNGTGDVLAPNNGTLDCSDPDPNRRPEECLLTGLTDYFPDQEIYWEGPTRERVARFTTIGNLLIRGEAIAYSTGAPLPGEFSLGYTNDDFATISTIWVDAAGNVHLKGALIEEAGNVVPPPGSYSFNNRRGITLAYADLRTGDLYLRGNIIPYRRSIE